MFGPPKPKTSKSNFVDYLDNLTDAQHKDYCTMANLLYLTHAHYFETGLFDSEFSGRMKMPFIKPMLNIGLYTDTPFETWKKNHEQYVIPKSNDIFTLKSSGTKEESKMQYIEIDVSLNDLGDVLQLIEKNPYKEDVEYNIDLKSLTNIRSELEQLNNMVGMKTLKSSILDQLIYFMQELHISDSAGDFKHTVLYGPPGTGKTEVAKIIGTMYSKLGILKNGIFKKVTRNDLIAGYLGQTAIKTKNVIQDCLGGVLFIDEAYSLANSYDEDMFSKECIDTLCEALSNHKNDLMVIIAGYEEELDTSFFRANPGMKSRFMWRFKTDKYTAPELKSIFIKKVEESKWTVSKDMDGDEWFEKRMENFTSFGRDMEMMFSYVKIAHARRIYGQQKETKKCITKEDLDRGYSMLLSNRKQENKLSKSFYSMYV